MKLSNPISGEVAAVTRDEFLVLYDVSVRPRIEQLLGRPDVAGVVSFENLDMCSSSLGHRSALIYGPGCDNKTAEAVVQHRLGDVPSRFQYPKHIFTKPA